MREDIQKDGRQIDIFIQILAANKLKNFDKQKIQFKLLVAINLKKIFHILTLTVIRMSVLGCNFFPRMI